VVAWEPTLMWLPSLRMKEHSSGYTSRQDHADSQGIRSRSGIIEIRFTSTPGHEAMIQASEVLPTHQ
jgi:hypothetical protein